jgi:transposase
LAGLSKPREVLVRKKFSRIQVLHFTPNVPVELIGMEACSGPHFLGNALREQGHEVHLMPAQRVDGKMPLDAALPRILEGGFTSLSGTLRFLLAERKQELE